MVVLRIVLLWLVTGMAWSDGKLESANLGDCSLDSGEVIRQCTVAYRRLGELNADQSNILIFPTWYTGTTEQLISFGYIGPGKLADTDHFHVIAVEAFGSGHSSSPSNSQLQPLEQFPAFTIRDMVRAQHRLLTEVLNIPRVAVVLGVSMGGMQAFEWLVEYPGVMDKMVAVEATPWPTPYDRLLWTAMAEASRWTGKDPDQAARASRQLGQLDALGLWTPERFNILHAEQDLESFMSGFAPPLDAAKILDRHYQTLAMLALDIRAGREEWLPGGQGKPQPDVLITVFERDHMVNPVPSIQLAESLGAMSWSSDTDCGHLGVDNSCAGIPLTRAVHEFLKD